MATEIERKFLVNSNLFKEEAYKKARIKQGYLNSNPERTVRVRLINTKGVLTVKGKSNKSGTTRFEWEKEVAKNEAEALLQLAEPSIIDKTRYYIKSENHIFEVDEFYGDNKGLLLAEIELKAENEKFTKPSWLGKEVTGNSKYYNSYLSKTPFTSW